MPTLPINWLNILKAPVGGPPAILSDGNTVAWFEGSEANVVKDGSDFVSQWSDISGNTNHLLQATGTNQPLWSSDGVLFDGIDNFMKCSPFTLNQPEFLYAVLNQITWGLTENLFDGNTLNDGMIETVTATPQNRAYAGTFSTPSSDLTLNTFHIIRLLFNGASSKYIIDANTPITGDFGAIPMSGFTLGARGDDARFAHIQVKEFIIRKIADAAGDEAAIYDYLKSKYGL